MTTSPPWGQQVGHQITDITRFAPQHIFFVFIHKLQIPVKKLRGVLSRWGMTTVSPTRNRWDRNGFDTEIA